MGRVLAIIAAVACAAAAAPQAFAYGWPLKPFDRQHAVRGNFNDPRLAGNGDGISESFHFGIDISAPDYTWVYAVAPGRAIVRGNAVRVRSTVRGIPREFEYWHIWPSVDTGDRIRLHQRLGQIAPRYLHVHFAEVFGGGFVNPLRPGALNPYEDTTQPVVDGVAFESPTGPRSLQAVAGTVDLVASVYDTPPVAPPAPWGVVRLSPATISWRIVQGPSEVIPWQMAVDFSASLTPRSLFEFIYAPGTRQNKKNRPGNYVYYLQHDFDTSLLPNGSYVLEVTAADTRGNTGTAAVQFATANP